jgi:hypothetical protein
MWLRAVARLTASAVAISSVDLPSARWWSTSSCRFVSEIASPSKPLLGERVVEGCIQTQQPPPAKQTCRRHASALFILPGGLASR